MAIGPFDIFLKLDGFKGEATHSKYKDQIVVLSWEQGVSQTVVLSLGGGASTGRAQFGEVRFRKPLDRSSPLLLVACAAGTHVRDGLFTFRNAASGVEVYKVKLTDVLITAVKQTASPGAQYPLSFAALDAGQDSTGFLDEVALHYAKIEWEYRPAGKGGTAAPAVKGGWDLVTNQKI